MDNIELSIIIVSWNVKKLLSECLRSIFLHQEGLNLQVIVIDNASIDSSQKMIKKDFNQVELIINKKNLGFAKAINQGLKLAQGQFILLLNPDTKILLKSLKRYLQIAKEILNLGVLGAHLLNPDQTNQLSIRCFPQFWSTLGLLLKLHIIFPKILNHYEPKDFDYNKQQEVDQVMGAAFLIPKSAIERVGLFDKHFFLWLEEVDYCYRVKQIGLKIIYAPEPRIIHHRAQSFSQVLPINRQKQFIKSMIYFFKKHKPKWQYICLLIIKPFSIFLSWLQTKLKLKMHY